MLQRWTAVSLVEQLREGRTQPMLLECASENNQSAQKVVKAVGLPEVTQRTLVCELLGNLIARAVGVVTAEPCLVEIPNAVAQQLSRSTACPILAGWAVGCEYLTNTQAWKSVKQLSQKQQAQAFRLFAFDMLAQNADRRPEKPNCGFTASSDLWAYDFDLCFAHCFVPLLGGSDVLETLAKQHLLYSTLKGQTHDWQGLKHALQQIGTSWWSEVLYNLPESWRSDAERVRDSVLQVVGDADNWLQSLRRWLM
ncbi:MAG: hypothetical protein N2651_00170 [Fimbriimonadales bacterium]|nr:hypothetical protein [Fimbriimonadales bacterium]